MLKPLKSYNSRNEIFTDLDLEETLMQALIDIFEDYGKFQYEEETKHCFFPKYDSSNRWNRIEKKYQNINFVLWISTNKD